MCFDYFKFQKFIRYESRNVDWVVMYLNLEFGMKIEIRDFKLGKFSVRVTIKIMGFNFLKVFQGRRIENRRFEMLCQEEEVNVVEEIE